MTAGARRSGTIDGVTVLRAVAPSGDGRGADRASYGANEVRFTKRLLNDQCARPERLDP